MVRRMDKIILFIGFLFFSNFSFNQNVTGKVMDDKGEPLPFVTIKIIGQNKGTTTDFDGIYNLEVSPKGDSLVFSYISFDSKKVFTTGGELNVVLQESVSELEEVVIKYERNSETENSLVVDKKNSMEVESSIGSKEMSKKGISNAEEGLKKVAGVTFSSSKINVRGLDDRYNQVTLNSIPLPSNNSDRKNLDLSLLPRSIIGNIKVKKSYSSNQWSNLSSSQIDITTDFLKDVNSLGIRLGTSTNGYLPIQSSNLTIGRKNIKNFGFLFTFNQSLNKQSIDGITRLYNKQGNNVLDYNYVNDVSNLNISTMLVGKYRLENLTFNSISLFVNSNNLDERISDGTHFDYESQIRTWRRSPSNHLLFNQQIISNYKKENLSFNSIASYSKVSSGESNRNQLVYLYDNGYYFNNIDKIDNHNFWSQSEEDRINFSLNGSYDFNNIKPELGYSYSLTNNKFDYQQEYYDLGAVNQLYYRVDPDSPYNYIDGNAIVYTVNNPSSLVEGYTNINAFYLKNDVNIKSFDLSFGVRGEIVQKKVEFREQFSQIFVRQYYLENFEILPYLNLKYKVKEKSQFRLTSSITTIRPRFREMTPFIYTEVFAGSKIQGNPELINSKVYNADFSYENYLKHGELLSFSLFGKFINNPIERVNVATASGRLETYQNSESAYVFGGEIELKKRIDKLTIDYNVSVLFSQINISENSSSSVIVTNLNRPLQGSTPILSNLDVFYNFNDSLSLGLTYNFVGKKLYSAGILGLGDVYQSPQSFLNLLFKYSVNKFDFNLSVNNILNSKIERRQQTDIGNFITDYYSLGTNLRLGIKYNL